MLACSTELMNASWLNDQKRMEFRQKQQKQKGGKNMNAKSRKASRKQ